jgi:hypothetical protein
MSEPNPQESDLVLGGQNPTPVNAAILGGLAGIKRRLKMESLQTRFQALTDAIQYGSDGFDLLIESLTDDDEDICRLARRLLRDRTGELGKEALLVEDPIACFTTLDDWRAEIYYPGIGIVDPENIAYIVRLTISDEEDDYDIDRFRDLIEDPRIGELQALIFQISIGSELEGKDWACGVAVKAICQAKSLFPNIKAIFIGDVRGEYYQYRLSQLHIVDIKPILQAFPNLEVLQVYGNFYDSILTCQGIRHEKLKSLVIETASMHTESLTQICSMRLPNLEYFQVWLGTQAWNQHIILDPILNMNVPLLKYLGICCYEEIDKSISTLLDSPILTNLLVLDLEAGTMTDNGAAQIAASPKLQHLKLLNTSRNYLSQSGIDLLREASFIVESRTQEDGNYGRYYSSFE